MFGNVGTITCFRVGAADAEVLEKEFEPQFTVEDLVNLPKWKIYLRLMIDGVASTPFSADTLPPIAEVTDSAEKLIESSRERYGRSREVIEEKIAKWSGVMGESDNAKTISTSGRGEVRREKLERKEKSSYEKKSITISARRKSSDSDKRKFEDKKEQKISTDKNRPQKQNKDDQLKKRRKRKKKSRDYSKDANSQPDFKKAKDVVIGDPDQKSVSLSDLKQHGQSDSYNRSDVQRKVH